MTFKLRSSGPFKMMGSSPTKHYTGSHKGAKKHPSHKLKDFQVNIKDGVKNTIKNVFPKLYDSLTGKPKSKLSGMSGEGIAGKGGKGSAGAAAPSNRGAQSMVPFGGSIFLHGVKLPKKGKFLKTEAQITKAEKPMKMNKKASKRTNLKSTQDKLNENIQKGVKTMKEDGTFKYSN